MRTWVRVIHSTDRALADAKAHLEELMRSEDSLSKAKSLEELHFQRGRVQGIRDVLFLLTSTSKKGD